MSAEVEPLFTVREVAALLRVSRWAINNWARCGRICSVELGRRARRFTRQEIDRLLFEGLLPVDREAKN